MRLRGSLTRRLFPALLGLSACGGTSETTASDAPAVTPYSYDPATGAAPALSPEEVAAAIQPWLRPLFDLRVTPVIEAYEGLLSQGDAACPAAYVVAGEAYSQSQWYNSCVASSGTSFEGSAYSQTSVATDANGYLVESGYYQLQTTIESAEGASLSASGFVVTSVATKSTDASWYKALQGDFRYDGPGAEGTWLGEGQKVYCETVAYTYFGLGNYVEMTAGLSGLTGDVTAVSTSKLKLYQATLGSVCEKEPSGSVSARGADGEWYDVVFDAPDDDHPDVDPALCDGCGVVYFRGEKQGQACLDFSELLSWEAPPW